MICKTEGCALETVGKSKYCRTHRAEARAAWKAMIQADAQERADRNAAWAALHAEAHAAGLAAVQAHVPTPMGVTDGKQTWIVEGGACGFAWVIIRPGNCSFALWLKKHGGERIYKGYRGGVQMFAPLNTQSVSTKEAYCEAYAKVLQSRGVKAFAQSALD